jgi:hypothetical protein
MSQETSVGGIAVRGVGRLRAGCGIARVLLVFLPVPAVQRRGTNDRWQPIGLNLIPWLTGKQDLLDR